MRFFIILAVMLGCTVGEGKAKDNKEKKPQTVYGELPGNGRPDQHFDHLWEHSIKDQKFPILPEVGKFDMSDDEKNKSVDDRKRYIFHLFTKDLIQKTIKFNEMEDGYYRALYQSKSQGTFVLVFHPKYRKCFDDLTKKFDEMQWVTLLNDRIDDPEGKGEPIVEMILETPRQCVGGLVRTGSKLPDAKKDLTAGGQ